MTVYGANELVAKMGSMHRIVESAVKRQVGLEITAIQSLAKLNAAVNHGELRRSIRQSVTDKDDLIVGKVYCTAPHAMLVEFGTGPKGQENHGGISPHVNPSYVNDPWFIHSSQIDEADALRYHMQRFEIKGEVFYKTHGQAAQPFMYPAYKSREDRALENIKNATERALKEVCND